jgi:hypothetical protein
MNTWTIWAVKKFWYKRHLTSLQVCRCWQPASSLYLFNIYDSSTVKWLIYLTILTKCLGIIIRLLSVREQTIYVEYLWSDRDYFWCMTYIFVDTFSKPLTQHLEYRMERGGRSCVHAIKIFLRHRQSGKIS